MAIYKYNISENNQMVYAMIDDDLPSQFMTKRKDVNIYLFSIDEITDEGIKFVCPLDQAHVVVPFYAISKVKSMGGEILAVEVYECADKMTLLQDLEGETPVTVFHKDTMQQFTLESIQFGAGGSCKLTLDNDTVADITDVVVLDKEIAFDGKKD